MQFYGYFVVAVIFCQAHHSIHSERSTATHSVTFGAFTRVFYFESRSERIKTLMFVADESSVSKYRCRCYNRQGRCRKFVNIIFIIIFVMPLAPYSAFRVSFSGYNKDSTFGRAALLHSSHLSCGCISPILLWFCFRYFRRSAAGRTVRVGPGLLRLGEPRAGAADRDHPQTRLLVRGRHTGESCRLYSVLGG